MTNSQITKGDLLNLKKELITLMTDMADKILQGVQRMFYKRDIILNKHGKILNKTTKDIDSIKTDVRFIRQDIKDMETELSDRPSRKQFEELKTKFDKYLTV